MDMILVTQVRKEMNIEAQKVVKVIRQSCRKLAKYNKLQLCVIIKMIICLSKVQQGLLKVLLLQTKQRKMMNITVIMIWQKLTTISLVVTAAPRQSEVMLVMHKTPIMSCSGCLDPLPPHHHHHHHYQQQKYNYHHQSMHLITQAQQTTQVVSATIPTQINASLMGRYLVKTSKLHKRKFVFKHGASSCKLV